MVAAVLDPIDSRPALALEIPTGDTGIEARLDTTVTAGAACARSGGILP